MGEETKVQAECPWSGTVTLSPKELRCAKPRRGVDSGLCEFACPDCGRTVILRTSRDGVAAVLHAGAVRASGPMPFELLEPHHGPPLSRDELLDLHLTMERTCCPQEELAA